MSTPRKPQPKTLSRDQMKTQLANAKIRLSEIDGELVSRTSQRNSATIVFIFGLLLAPFGVGIVLILFSLWRYFSHKAAIRELDDERASVVRRITRLETELMG